MWIYPSFTLISTVHRQAWLAGWPPDRPCGVRRVHYLRWCQVAHEGFWSLQEMGEKWSKRARGLLWMRRRRLSKSHPSPDPPPGSATPGSANPPGGYGWRCGYMGKQQRFVMLVRARHSMPMRTLKSSIALLLLFVVSALPVRNPFVTCICRFYSCWLCFGNGHRVWGRSDRFRQRLDVDANKCVFFWCFLDSCHGTFTWVNLLLFPRGIAPNFATTIFSL